MAGAPSARGKFELLTFELCCGMAAYSRGASFGEPFIHLGPVGLSGDIENSRKPFQTYGKRFTTFFTKFAAIKNR